ncbi:MAG TPA: hypothetical protein PLF22_11145 [Pseudomonadales bacterium]|nr:hypothetical protein [Pseudomonadales bacterium]
MLTVPQRNSLWPASIYSALLLAAGFLAYGATGHDDAHINFWSAYTLLEHGQFLNYNGERIEQTTNLLQDILTAILHLVSRMDLVTCGFLVDIMSAFACIMLGIALVRRTSSMTYWISTMLCSSSSFMLWSFGGMGATLAAFCLLATIYVWDIWIDSTAPNLKLKCLLLSTCLALTLERPEMPLIAIALACWMLALNITNTEKRKRCLQLLALSLSATVLLFGWQQLYFSSWLPVPALAKQGGSLHDKLQLGYIYIVFNSVLNPVVVVSLLLLPCYWWQQHRNPASNKNRRTLFCLLSGATFIYLGFIWAAGGDWMQAGRFFVPILPTTSLLLVMTLGNLPSRWATHITLAVLCSLQALQQYITTIPKLSHGIPAWTQFHIADQHQRYSLFEKLNQEHLRDMGVIDHLAQIIPGLHTKLNRPVILMSGQAGMVFYYTAREFGNDVQFRDLRGLVEDSLTRCPVTADIRKGSQGIFWGYREFFALLPQLQAACGIAPPDLIYDINDMTQKLGKTLEPYGYTLIHSETGFLIENSTALPYNRLLSPNMIFIRNELLPLLDHQEKIIIDYNRLPLQSRF